MDAKKAEQDKLWSGMEAEFSGQNAETVVRDRRGRKLEMLNEFMNQVKCWSFILFPCKRECFGFLTCEMYGQEAFKEGRAAKQAKEEYEWGRGLVQKEKDDEFRKELEDIKNAPFAR